MKINPIQNKDYIQNYKVGRHILSEASGVSGSATDKVSFSDEALSFSKVLSDIKEQIQLDQRSPEELTRIADITQKVRSGQYSIDSAAVAEKIINRE